MERLAATKLLVESSTRVRNPRSVAANLSVCWWGEAAKHVVYTLNRIRVVRDTGKCPVELENLRLISRVSHDFALSP